MQIEVMLVKRGAWSYLITKDGTVMMTGYPNKLANHARKYGWKINSFV